MNLYVDFLYFCIKANQLNVIEMKKVLFAIVVLACVVCLSSCSKKCYCKATINGEEVVGSTVTKDNGKKCSDYNYRASLAGQTVEYKCTMSL